MSRLLGEQFTVSLCCIGPICIIGGFIIFFTLTGFFQSRKQGAGEERKGIRWEIPESFSHVLAFFPAGLVSFLLARWVLNFSFFNSEWNVGSYFKVTLGLVFIALLFAFAYGISDVEGPKLKISREKSILAFWGSYVGGVISASLLTWLFLS